MNTTTTNAQIGLIAGLLLAIAGVTAGFGGFVIAVLLGVVGLLIGRYLDGDLDVSEFSERTGLAGRGTGRRNRP